MSPAGQAAAAAAVQRMGTLMGTPEWSPSRSRASYAPPQPSLWYLRATSLEAAEQLLSERNVTLESLRYDSRLPKSRRLQGLGWRTSPEFINSEQKPLEKVTIIRLDEEPVRTIGGGS